MTVKNVSLNSQSLEIMFLKSIQWYLSALLDDK